MDWTGVTADAAALGFDPGRLARITPWMQAYADARRWPGGAVLIARHGRIAYADGAGLCDLQAGTPWRRDLIVRLWSMAKPVTAVALLILLEEARLHLDDPVEDFLPEFRDLRVLIPGAMALDQTVPAARKITLHDLLTHRSGLSLFVGPGLLGAAYGQEGLGLDKGFGGLDRLVRRIAGLPLDFQPGTRWQYSVGPDVIGRVIEVVSGQTFDRFLADRIFEPLGMVDTGFDVPVEKIARLPPMYRVEGGGVVLDEKPGDSAWRRGRVDTFLGGGGLVGTIDDYWRFTEMLRGGGALRGTRILSPRTLALATANHLPGDLAPLATEVWTETQFDGVGFCLLGAVVVDPAKGRMSARVGDYDWGGAAGTFFFVSPAEDLVAILFTQLLPSSALPVRRELRTLVQAALIGD